MITTNYLTDLVTKYFSTVFFLWVVANILLRLLVTKKKKKKKKRKRRGGGIGDVFYVIWCALRWLLTFGQYGCPTKDDTYGKIPKEWWEWYDNDIISSNI
jgi:hypothetical protein